MIMRCVLLLLVLLLEKPVVFSELSQSEIRLLSLRAELKEAAKDDPCRKLKSKPSQGKLSAANQACLEILQKFRLLPPNEQYTCQAPSEPAQCVGHKSKWSTKYDCCFEVQFQATRSSIATPRFKAKMTDCIAPIKLNPFVRIPVVEGKHEAKVGEIEVAGKSKSMHKTRTRPQMGTASEPGSKSDSGSGSESDSGSDNIYSDPVFAAMRRHKADQVTRAESTTREKSKCKEPMPRKESIREAPMSVKILKILLCKCN